MPPAREYVSSVLVSYGRSTPVTSVLYVLRTGTVVVANYYNIDIENHIIASTRTLDALDDKKVEITIHVTRISHVSLSCCIRNRVSPRKRYTGGV